MKEQIKLEIKKHALDETPNECCGILLQNEKKSSLEIFKCKNMSPNKAEQFSISPGDYLKASKKGKILAFYHSHPSEEDSFSEYDKLQSEQHNVKFILYCVKKKSFHEYEPKDYVSSYVGRDFELGVNDCLTLGIDYYKNECNIKVKNYYRDRNWFIENPNSYQEHFEEEGFIKILNGPLTKKDLPKIKKHDFLLMKYLGKNFPTHGANYVGNGLILHHQINCYSRIEPYNGVFLERTVGVLRHESLL
jgi:proteasome lid subunit RPN8/RPN11